MGRDKLKRNLQFKPLYKEFAPIKAPQSDTIVLLHEEMEALYLMDNLGLYQADAANKMGVSRPTFARIIKSAREKVTMMLVSGAKLVIEDEKKDLKVAVASISNEKLIETKANAAFFFIYSLHEDTTDVEVVQNPTTPEEKPAKILPTFFQELGVNFFVAQTIGEGLQKALLAKGIFAKEQEKFLLSSFK